MIEVSITHDGEEIAHINIINFHTLQMHDGLADYTVQYAVERGSAVGLHVRTIEDFPRKKFNALALVRQALMTLEPKELELEHDFDPDQEDPAPSPRDLVRRLRHRRR